jgi:hypothetical protein
MCIPCRTAVTRSYQRRIKIQEEYGGSQAPSYDETNIPFLSKRQVLVHPIKILVFYFKALLYNKLDYVLRL